MGRTLGVLAAFSLTAVPAMAQTVVSNWAASSGFYPDQVSPVWTFGANGGSTLLSGGVLTITSSSGGNDPNFSQTTSLLPTPVNTWTMEFEMRVVSGSSTEAWRASAGVRFSTESGNVGNGLFIERTGVGTGTIFINQGPSGSESRAATFALDTTVFHLYRIELDPNRDIRVFVDGVQRLTGATFVNTSLSQPIPQLAWGDLAGAASGVSEWKSFNHTASAIPEPGTVAALMGVAALVTVVAFRRRRAAN